MTTGITDILHFFLSVYRLQIHAPRAYGQYIPVSSMGTDFTYELRVETEGKTRSRRITVGPLGEETGSKSKCFKVIYDDVLVIKIPPTPVTYFDRYIECLQAEAEIAKKLSPSIECIAPSVSAILKKLPPFSGGSETDPARFEARCIQQLRQNPELQKYLKIGNHFAFFMNLSRNYFLGQVMVGLHDVRHRIFDELISRTDVLENPEIFENVYGNRHLPHYYALNNLFFRFDEQVAALQKSADIPALITPYQKKCWFLSHIAGGKAEPDGKTFSKAFIDEINSILGHLIRTRPEAEDFRKIVQDRLRNRAFEQNRPLIAGLIVSLLDLLARLRRQGVAIRDLKPDNAFIAGDSSRLPLLLASPGEYAIGLIDFETSVIFETLPGSLRQPMLAGTPSYATPSHIFKNEILKSAYDDLPRVFHFQDWQAVISMIYIAITGEHLARKTSRLMPEFIKVMKKSIRQKIPVPRIFKGINRLFWVRASEEFRERLVNNEAVLMAVKVKVPENAEIMLREELLNLLRDVEAEIGRHLEDQQFVSDPKILGRLKLSGSRETARHRMKWERPAGGSEIPPGVQKRIIPWLRRLERLKDLQESHEAMMSMLKNSRRGMTAFHILQIMFSIIHHQMFDRSWGEFSQVPRNEGRRQADLQDLKISAEEVSELEKTFCALSQ